MSVEIVAEMSASHNGDLMVALEICEQAKACGADAIKLQTMQAETMCADGSDEHCLITQGPWAGRRMIDLYRECAMPREWHIPVIKRCMDLGLPWFSTPFAPEDVDFLESLGCPRYKVASFEVTDTPLLNRIGKTGKPVVISTGMAEDTEIDGALDALGHGGVTTATILHCVSEYPATHMNMGGLEELAWVHRVGLSDHSMSPVAAILAVGIGAVMIEKHLCLRRADGGPDSGFALEPHEFKEHVRLIREAEQAMLVPAVQLGQGNLRFRKGLWIIKDVAEGEHLGPHNVRALRPMVAMEPGELQECLGRRFLTAQKAQTPLTPDMLAPLF